MAVATKDLLELVREAATLDGRVDRPPGPDVRRRHVVPRRRRIRRDCGGFELVCEE
ncbi:hypothetical protein [Haloarchaeobius sp. HRN-SO-5]|uniref:hypothetical protein n=1 Tax=Haloarchaeobius sp. HRN-SO-5 TaxID=3446118 RepID=UPI003EB7348F